MAAALSLTATLAPTVSSSQEARPRPEGFVPVAVQPWFEPVARSPLVETPWLTRLVEDLATPDESMARDVSWNSAFEEREAGTHDSRTLIGWRARISSPLWAGKLSGDVNLLAVEPPNSVGLALEPRRWLGFTLAENWGVLSLGVRVESISPGLEGISGGKVKGEKEGGEAWLEGREGLARFRLSGGQSWDNVADYPWQARTTKTQGGASIDVALPAGAALTVAYQAGVTEREPGRYPRTRQTAAPGTSAFHSVMAALSCAGPTWTITVASTYSPSSDKRSLDRETISVTHDVSASFSLLPSLTITPVLSLAEDTYTWSDTRSQTTSASVSVSWTSLLEGVDLAVSGSYVRNLTTEDVYDATAIHASAGIIWHLRRTGRTRTSFALEVGSNRYLDRLTPSARYAELYGMLTFRIATF